MSVYDAIAASTPLDKTAAMVAGSGEHFQPKRQYKNVIKERPDTSVITQNMRIAPGFVDYTGREMGRLTVLGRGTGKNNSWVCRCVCGNFMMLKNRTVNKFFSGAQSKTDRCDECHYTDYLRNLPPLWRETAKKQENEGATK